LGGGGGGVGAPGILANRALVYLALHRYHEAINDLNQATEIEPCNARNFFNRGMVILTMISSQRAKPITPPMGTSAEHHCMVMLQRPQNDELTQRAIKDFSRVHLLEPDNVQALINRGTLYAICNEFSQAIDDYTLALTKNPTPDVECQIRFVRANAHRARGDTGNALLDYAFVIEHLPTPLNHTTSAHACMALVYSADCHLEKGEFEQAKDAINKALEIDRSFAPVCSCETHTHTQRERETWIVSMVVVLVSLHL
jgi:tetratricopeptide (TPR) repeat protein